MSSSNRVRIVTIEETDLGVTPVDVPASTIIQNVLYTAVAIGAAGNGINIQYFDTAIAGAETVTVVGNEITVGIEDGVTTAQQVLDAIEASVDASALVTVALDGSGALPQTVTGGLIPTQGGITNAFDTARFISETLSGSPGTTESQQIRSDRQSSGQVLTSLELGGEINFELAKEAQLEKFMQAAMFNTWEVQPLQTVNLSIDATAKTITRASGDWNLTVDVGDILTLAGFVTVVDGVVVNNTQVQVLEIVSPTVIRCSFNEKKGLVVTEVGTGTTYKRADRLSIGTLKRSFSMEKAFLDLQDKAIIYKGMIASAMNLDITYGEIITGSFGFSGTEYTPVASAASFLSNNRVLNPAATSESMNGSVDMPFINSAITGTLAEADFCIQSVSLALDNNLTTQTCIGQLAPANYSEGTAAIEVSMSAYLSDDNWAAIALKISQEPVALGFMVENLAGWYGFYLPAVQLSFSDPASGGPNQEVSLEMSGQAKIGANGESALYIYRS